MSQPDLMTEIAELITDMRRMDYHKDDPMRFSKRAARELAASILRDAVQQARQALSVRNWIESDHENIVRGEA